MAEAQPRTGNGQQVAASLPSDQTVVIAAQQATITAQAALVQSLENQLMLSPGMTPPVPGTGVMLQAVIDAQGAAVRTQAAYVKHLQETATALGITLT